MLRRIIFSLAASTLALTLISLWTAASDAAPPRVQVSSGQSSQPTPSTSGGLAERLQSIQRGGAPVSQQRSILKRSAPVKETPAPTYQPSRTPEPKQPPNDPVKEEAQEPAEPAPVAPSFTRSRSDTLSSSSRRTARALPAPLRSTPSTRPAMSSDDNPNLLASSVAPAIRIDTMGPAEAIVNREKVYTIKAANVSEDAAGAIHIRAEIPQWVEVAEIKPTVGEARLFNQDGTGVEWTISHLQGMQSETLKLTLIPRETHPVELAVSHHCDPTEHRAKTIVQEPKLEMTIAGPKDILYGESKIYTISLVNPGTGDAENVTLALSPLTPNQPPLQAKNIGVIKAGQRKDIDVELIARHSGMLKLEALATADDNLKVEVVEDILVRRAKLEIAIAGPEQKYAGHPAEYQVTVSNRGDASASKVTATATLPKGAEVIGGGPSKLVDKVEFAIGQLGPGDSRTFTFTCLLNQPGDNEIAVQIAGEGETPHQHLTTTKVEAIADLKLYVNDPPGPIPTGKDVTYELRLVNRGANYASEIKVAAFFSDGIEPIEVLGAQGEIGTGQVDFAPIERLDPGQERVLKITARAHKPGNHVFRAVVQCPKPETRLAAEETTRYFGETRSPVSAPSGPATTRFEEASPVAQPLESAQDEPEFSPTPAPPNRFEP